MNAESPQPKNRLRWLGSEILLGTLVALLSIFTGLASFQGSQTDSEQNKYENNGLQALVDANAEYLAANQDIMYDYSLFDSWFLEERGEREDYFFANFSDPLFSAIQANPEDPFSDQYYNEMYGLAREIFDQADQSFALAEEFDARGDQLQLVMLIMAIGLAFTAWASLLDYNSRMRLLFAALALITAAVGIITYLGVPSVSV
jgi:hypothetical protein